MTHEVLTLVCSPPEIFCSCDFALWFLPSLTLEHLLSAQARLDHCKVAMETLEKQLEEEKQKVQTAESQRGAGTGNETEHNTRTVRLVSEGRRVSVVTRKLSGGGETADGDDSLKIFASCRNIFSTASKCSVSLTLTKHSHLRATRSSFFMSFSRLLTLFQMFQMFKLRESLYLLF